MFQPNKTKLVAGFIAVLILASCVTKKTYDATVADLNATKTRLETSDAEQQKLKTELDLLKVSVAMDKKEAAAKQRTTEYNIYKTSISAGDYYSAAQSLTRLAEIDSANRPLYYDSLAWYHYFYLYPPGTVRQSPAAYHFTMKGLTLNPNNLFLQEIKAKLDLEEQRDTMSLNAFNRLYAKTGDYTYLWDITFIELYALGNVKKADSIINMVIKRPDSEVKKVRLEHLQEKMTEEIAAKAAFLYLRAVIQNANGSQAKAMKSLEEAIKYAPNFYYAKLTLDQLKNPQKYQQQGGGMR